MNTKEILKQFEQVATYYIEELSKYSPNEFTRKPSEDEWSLGQMYNHLIRTALYMQLGAIEKGLNGEAHEGGEKTEAGQHVYMAGTFPPIRIKVPPQAGYTPKNPIDKNEVKEGMLQLMEKMREVEPKLINIPENRKVEHPRFGYLNAVEWFQLIQMHFRHHLLQKERIDQFLLNESK
ncbi:DinB family protein [Bacillus sp. BRMEA1]|uniref:DinB family protein n=1 Tax=Neobacillus endophyticus TaxID=2738405 RepID=UPI001564EF37|nr:DinB family protein [Neobacillus endophyticus]NRD79918.1 DinB family protein [Neobacillus endophyticus]